MDMLHGAIGGKLFRFSLPIALTGVAEQFFNSVDVLILGQFVGKEAMAAVGNDIPAISLLVLLLLGLSMGVNVVMAQHIGGRHEKRAEEAAHTAILVALIMGLLLMLLGEALTAVTLDILEVPPEVYEDAATYWRIFLVALPFLALYNFEAAIFRSSGDSRTPLYSLIAASLLNAVLDIAAVHLGLGLAGVVWATVVAYIVNALILWVLLTRGWAKIRLEAKKLRLSLAELIRIVRIGLPAGAQGMVFALSNILIQAAINSLGPNAMAASTAALTIEFNVYCFMNAFGQAVTTFVGLNYGAGNMARCLAVTRAAFKVGGSFMASLSLVTALFAEPLLRFFSDDPAVIALGVVRVHYVTGLEFINGFLDILSGTMRGYGFSLPPAVVTLVGVCGIRITWLHTYFPAHPDFAGLMLNYPVSWAVTAALLALVYWYYRREVLVPRRESAQSRPR
ncbi:MAG: MATE family efflux transporter [Schwartzia sp. (in: firmicutes)]